MSEVEEIIQHYPPRYLIGITTGEEREILNYETEQVIVRLIEVEA